MRRSPRTRSAGGADAIRRGLHEIAALTVRRVDNPDHVRSWGHSIAPYRPNCFSDHASRLRSSYGAGLEKSGGLIWSQNAEGWTGSLIGGDALEDPLLVTAQRHGKA